MAAFIIIIFSYASMFYSVHQSTITATEIRNQVKKEMILAKRFFFIVFTDALCWIPVFVLKFLSLLQVEIPGTIFFSLLKEIINLFVQYSFKKELKFLTLNNLKNCTSELGTVAHYCNPSTLGGQDGRIT